MKMFIYAMVLFGVLRTNAQNLPLRYIDHSDTTKPLIIYLSGDGGMNSFTNGLMQTLNNKGFAVLALDAKNYFWHKKEPDEFAGTLSQVISVYLKNKERNSFVVLGYSFGADVAPFLTTRLPAPLYNRCKSVMMLSPSVSTNFEIKILDMLGWGNKKGGNVVDELNKLSIPVVLFFGSDETQFPINDIRIKRQVVVIKGGHHYDNNVEELASTLITKL